MLHCGTSLSDQYHSILLSISASAAPVDEEIEFMAGLWVCFHHQAHMLPAESFRYLAAVPVYAFAHTISLMSLGMPDVKLF